MWRPGRSKDRGIRRGGIAAKKAAESMGAGNYAGLIEWSRVPEMARPFSPNEA
jgi:hypothetical protein